MGSLLLFAFSWWGILLQAFAIIHFIRRRPDTFWLWIILIGGWLGALVYIAVEAVPDAGLLRQSFKVFPRRKRIRELESAILDNPSAGNYEELGDLYLEEGQFARARQAYDKAISSRTDSPDPFYRRGVAAIRMGDFTAALPDLERVAAKDPTYDFHGAAGLLAQDFHFLRDLLQLRLLSCVSATKRRSAPVGPANPVKEAQHARIFAAPRATLVPQGKRIAKASARVNENH
jgi:hypothetical protein